MYDADAIAAINFEQLVTRTDRLLVYGGRLPRRRPSTNRVGPALREPAAVPRRPNAMSTTTIALGSALAALALVITILA